MIFEHYHRSESCMIPILGNFPSGHSTSISLGQDSIFKSSGHITGASGFSPKTWPGKILLISWTWRLGHSNVED